MDSSGQQISNPSTNCTPFAITCADHNHIYASKCRIVCPLCSLELERVVIPPGLMKKEDITTGAEFRGFKADLDKYITLSELEGTKLKAFPSVSTPVSHKDQHSTAKADSVQEADKCPRCSADGFQGQCYVCGYGTGIGNANHIKEQYQDCFESSPAQHNTSSCGTRPPFELPMHKHMTSHIYTPTKCSCSRMTLGNKAICEYGAICPCCKSSNYGGGQCHSCGFGIVLGF
jgi:hypothetical protein